MTRFAITESLTRMRIEKVLKAAFCVALLSCSLALAACGDSKDPELPDTGGASSAEMSAGVLSFTVTSDDWEPAQDGDAIVKITGQTDAGRPVSDQYVAAVPDERYLTDLAAGEYEVSFTKMRTESARVFKAEMQRVQFDGQQDANVVLAVALDADATALAEKEAAERAAAEEAAAREAEAARIAQEEAAAAEAQRIAEEQAAAAEAQRIAEEQAAAEAAAAAAAQQNERTVYVAASGNGKKYHSSPSCSRMKGTISLTVSQAEAQGYGPCSKCY